MPPAAPGGAGAHGTPPRRKTSGAAIASLIFGILGCVPFITGLLAILFGFLGIRATGRPNTSGRGLAIAGLILGVLSIGLWSLFGGGMYAAWAFTKPAREASRQFAADLAAGNLDAAQARTTGAITRDQLAAASEKIKGWGAFQDTTLPVAMRSNVNGVDTAQVAGVATFANAGNVPYALIFVKQGGELKVDGFKLSGPGGDIVAGTRPDASSTSGSRGIGD
jgi:hypothetical protein